MSTLEIHFSATVLAIAEARIVLPRQLAFKQAAPLSLSRSGGSHNIYTYLYSMQAHSGCVCVGIQMRKNNGVQLKKCTAFAAGAHFSPNGVRGV